MTEPTTGVGDPPVLAFVRRNAAPLESGDYALTATHTVATPDGQGEAFQTTQQLHVAGARYQLAPAAVNSVYPPAGNQGDFANVLPHVVLTDPTLPWQRTLSGKPPKGPDAAPTWLALLLFDEQDPPPHPEARTLGDLATTNPVFAPSRVPEHGEIEKDPVTTLDVPAALYAQIAPSAGDLDWTAHVRQTPVAAKPVKHRPHGGPGAARDGGSAPAPSYAVVVGSRLPAPGRVSTVHLVSLEGFGPYLPSHGGKIPPALPSGVTHVRLVTLRSWSFSTIALNQTFEGVVGGLDLGSGLQLAFDETLADDDAGADIVRRAFGMGYTAMDHTLRDGSSTVSWYRGPLLPVATKPPSLAPHGTADSALRYDPGSGMFDVSYAAAWELGRLLALHDRAYATALYRRKLVMTQDAALALEREVVDALLPPVAGAVPHPLVRAVRHALAPAVERLAAGEAGNVRPPAPRRRVDPATLQRRLAEATEHDVDDTTDDADMHQVLTWLTELHLLKGVPFGYLVPEEGMLSTESIRFFRVDDLWIEALLDGALSIATAHAATGVTQTLKASLPQAVRARVPAVRRALLGEVPGVTAGPEALTGFLLRSTAVSGWPGMEVHGFSDAAATQPLDIVRLEAVAPSTLLGIFAGDLACVEFREPLETLHFGVERFPPKSTSGKLEKSLRYANGNATTAVGSTIPHVRVRVPLRATGAGAVVAMAELAERMGSKVWAPPVPKPAPTLTAAEFALELVEQPEAIRFRVHQ